VILQKLQAFSLNKDELQIGAVHISSDPALMIKLNYTDNINAFAGIFLNSKQDVIAMKNSTPNVANSLSFISSVAFSLPNGGRKNSRKFIIHTYTGYDKNSTDSIKVTQTLTNENITVISIGVGKNYNDDNVLGTASSAYFAFFTELLEDGQWHLAETDFNFMLDFVHTHCSERVNA
jgi:hypothetical protein